MSLDNLLLLPKVTSASRLVGEQCVGGSESNAFSVSCAIGKGSSCHGSHSPRCPTTDVSKGRRRLLQATPSARARLTPCQVPLPV